MMKRACKGAFIVCLSFLYWCLPLTARGQYGSLYDSFGGYWQPQYNQPYPNFPSQIWTTNPFTTYNPYRNQMAFANLSAGWQSPYFQQNNPYRFQQNNLYQIGPYGNVNLNNLASSRLVSAYSNGNNLNNFSYYGNNYGYVLPYGSGPSTYFHLLPANYMQNDPYTLAQQAKSTTSHAPEYNETVIGKVVGSNSLDVNGRIIRCWENSSPAQAVAGQPLDLSSYVGMRVEVTGDFFGNDLYSASFDGVVE